MQRRYDRVLEVVHGPRPSVRTFHDAEGHAWFTITTYAKPTDWESSRALSCLLEVLQASAIAAGEALDHRFRDFLARGMTIIESAQRDEKLVHVNTPFREAVKQARIVLDEQLQCARFLQVLARLSLLFEAVQRGDDE
jgi:hypothetical protein